MTGDDEQPEEGTLSASPAAPWPLLTRLPQLLADGAGDRAAFRSLLTQAHEELKERFFAGEPVDVLVHARAAVVDAVLEAAWRIHAPPEAAPWALVAVGGYGRGELHPASDIDILVLVPETPGPAGRAMVEKLLAFLWDIGLALGHHIGTVAQCAQEAASDITTMTTFMEARLITGDPATLAQLNAALAPEHLWPVRDFFDAKVREQALRHMRAHDTAYNLEPDVKTGPGGLRDIQTISWVARRQSGCQTLDELASHGFLTAAELRRLKQARSFLWKIRFGLHVLTGRHEDRLLFDNQIRLAQCFGYEDAAYTLAVEQLMQRYYRTVMEVTLLNELLLQLFRENLAADDTAPAPLNARFQVRNGALEAISDDVFLRNPSALLELFVLLQQHPQINGVRARTMRAVSRSLWLIDEEFRQNPRHHRLFLEILRAPTGVAQELRRMNNYGVLGRYIPAFGRIVGRMQYDLFHAYTVDAHTLFVVSNLRRFTSSQHDEELPQASRVMQQLPRPEIAYLAALFHDLAKGRGGDHSQLGAVDAEAFCLEQGLSPYDARLVAWLVQHHLELSITSQKQDISDPQVINAFARKVGDQTHLDYLYVLTCADVRGTNPKLWNNWKATLFHDLYMRAKRVLLRGMETIDQEQQVRETQDAARALLAQQNVTAVEQVWTRFSPGYFVQHSPEEVAWHTRLLAERPAGSDEPLLALDPRSVRGTTAVLLYARPRRNGFARTTAVLDQLGLNIVDARITPSGDGCSLDLYHVLEDDGAQITDPDRQQEIEQALWRSLRTDDTSDSPRVLRHLPRQARVFHTPTQINLSVDESNHRSVLELIAGDRPGLLCDVGKVLMEESIELQAARIVTVGERAEDVFYVTDYNNEPLTPGAAERLTQHLLRALTPRQAA